MKNMYYFFLIILFHCLISATASLNISIVMTMIIRDEEVNIRSNLALWKPIIDFYVFLVDSRTTDNSILTIQDILGIDGENYQIISNAFNGFGDSRTKSLDAAWKYFPQATHVLISDPDWRPDVNTMNKQDLDDNHDVFGFTSFDRTGITTRTMHWLLRHRHGLKMRYNVHEVLDIGENYSWKNLNWVIFEIEQYGSWHTTVGHGHSMSMKRHLFDIELLEKDLIEYGHDAHTHYYLGVTHESVATYLFGANVPDTNSKYLYHINEAIKYLTLRLHSKYNREYVDERINCMLTLGNIYTIFQNNFDTAEYWLQMARDFAPTSTEVRVALMKLYLHFEVFEKSFELIDDTVKMGKKEKIGLSFYKSWDCDLPCLILATYHKALLDQIITSIDDMKRQYFLLLIAMIEESDVCSIDRKLTKVWKSTFNIQQRDNNNLVLNLCADENVLNYLRVNRILLHPCHRLKSFNDRLLMCSYFYNDLPPINEDLQVRRDGSFIGALSIDDLIHHFYSGNLNQFLRDFELNSFKVLFAEYFNVKLVFYTIGYWLRNPYVPVDIKVLTPYENVILHIQQTLQVCGIEIYPNITITYEQSSLNDFKYDGPSFNYIEYNGGLSLDSLDPLSNIQILKSILDRKVGIIGITYFASNKRVFETQQLVNAVNSNEDRSFLYSFSSNHKHIVDRYLRSLNVSFLAQDFQLLEFFSGSMKQSRSLSETEVLKIIDESGLSVLTWLPKAFIDPFEYFKVHDILSYQSIGLNSTQFVEQIMPSFRFSMYLSNNPIQCSNNILNCLLKQKQLLDKYQLVNRYGSINDLFSERKDMMRIQHYAIPSTMKLDFYIPTSIRHCIELLDKHISLYEFFRCSEPHEIELLRILSTLEALGFVVFQSSPSFSQVVVKTESCDITLNNTIKLKIEKLRNLGFPEKVIEDSIVDYQRESCHQVDSSKVISTHDPLEKKQEDKEIQKDEIRNVLQHLIEKISKTNNSAIATDTLNISSSLAKNEMEKSPRHLQCINPLNHINSNNYCNIKPKRSTADILLTSKSKLNFDISQLQLILKDIELIEETSKNNIIVALTELLNLQQFVKDVKNSKPVIISSKYAKYMNRFLYIHNLSNDFESSQLIFKQAGIQINLAMGDLVHNDFIVIDVIMKSYVQSYLYSMLMYSTIWFDLSNSRVYASHHDDGLVFPEIKHLAKQLADVISTSQTQYHVRSFSVLTADRNIANHVIGPLMVAEEGDLIAALWIGHLDDISNDEDDGIMIFDSNTMTCLQSQGISKFPSVHPDFLSSSKGLFIDTHKRCKSVESEVIPMKANRLILINSGIPFYLYKSDTSIGDNSQKYLFTIYLYKDEAIQYYN